ncbi:MAG: S-layer homology domain-containing protein, partial [Candidatus Thorarchaeota archaeon]
AYGNNTFVAVGERGIILQTGVCKELFNDVSGHWAENLILATSCAGIANGYGNGSYMPHINVTRAQMAVFIIRALEGDPGEGYCRNTDPFTDVAYDHWACGYIKRLSELDISSGYQDNMFKPAVPVNRAQMAVYIVRALEGNPPDNYCGGVDPFTDISSSHWACGHIKRLSELGITAGYPDGTYKPSKKVNRGEIAVYIGRAFLGM